MKKVLQLVLMLSGLTLPCQAMWLAQFGSTAAGHLAANVAGSIPFDRAAQLAAGGVGYARELMGAKVPLFDRGVADSLLVNFDYKALSEWLNTCIDRHEPGEYQAVKTWLTENLRQLHFPVKYLYIKMILSDTASNKDEVQEALVQMIVCAMLFTEDALCCQAHGLPSENQAAIEDIKKSVARKRLHGKAYRFLGGYKTLYQQLIKKFFNRCEQFKGDRTLLPGLEEVGDYGAAFEMANQYFTAAAWLTKVRHVPAWASGAHEHSQTGFSAVYKGIYFNSLDEYTVSAALGSRPMKESILAHRRMVHGSIVERFGSMHTWRSFFNNALPLTLDDAYHSRAAARSHAESAAGDDENDFADDPYSDYSDDEVPGIMAGGGAVAQAHTARSVGRADDDARSYRSEARRAQDYGLTTGSVGKAAPAAAGDGGVETLGDVTRAMGRVDLAGVHAGSSRPRLSTASAHSTRLGSAAHPQVSSSPMQLPATLFASSQGTAEPDALELSQHVAGQSSCGQPLASFSLVPPLPHQHQSMSDSMMVSAADRQPLQDLDDMSGSLSRASVGSAAANHGLPIGTQRNYVAPVPEEDGGADSDDEAEGRYAHPQRASEVLASAPPVGQIMRRAEVSHRGDLGADQGIGMAVTTAGSRGKQKKQQKSGAAVATSGATSQASNAHD
jgi:hypothetical protein